MVESPGRVELEGRFRGGIMGGRGPRDVVRWGLLLRGRLVGSGGRTEEMPDSRVVGAGDGGLCRRRRRRRRWWLGDLTDVCLGYGVRYLGMVGAFPVAALGGVKQSCLAPICRDLVAHLASGGGQCTGLAGLRDAGPHCSAPQGRRSKRRQAKEAPPSLTSGVTGACLAVPPHGGC